MNVVYNCNLIFIPHNCVFHCGRQGKHLTFLSEIIAKIVPIKNFNYNCGDEGNSLLGCADW